MVEEQLVVKEQLNESKMMQVLDWSYDKAVNGLGGMENTRVLADSYMNKAYSIDEAIDRFIASQQAKCAASGFITGLGGLVTLPISVPANITSVIFIQMRMVATIATMKGYDLNDDRVRNLVYLALIGQAATDVLKDVGIKIGTQMSTALIKKIPMSVIRQINKAVGFKLVTKFGEKGVISLGKCVPLLGGIIGGTVDAVGTLTIGKTAKKIFT